MAIEPPYAGNRESKVLKLRAKKYTLILSASANVWRGILQRHESMVKKGVKYHTIAQCILLWARIRGIVNPVGGITYRWR